MFFSQKKTHQLGKMHPGKSRDSPASKSTGSSRVNQLLKLPTQAMDLVHYFVLRKSWDIPSGNLSHNYGKSPCFMGKFTRNGGLSISDATNYQRLVDLVETHPTKKNRKNAVLPAWQGHADSVAPWS